MKTVVFDFDGVIHKYREGWKDGSIYDEIDLEVLRYMRELMKKGIAIAIVSTRDSLQISRKLNGMLEGLYFEREKDIKFFNSTEYVAVTNQKIAATLYIDDRGFRYSNLEDLKSFMRMINLDNKSE